ncbi:MAG: sporulation protein YqfD [Peptococcia bacterium]
MDWQLGVKGYLEISLTGTNPERVINMAMSRGINVWDIRHDAQGRLRCKIRIGGYKALRYLVRRSGCRIRIERKQGLPFLLHRVKKRKVLVAGIVAFCVIIYVLSGFVWFLEVTGNEQVATEIILQNVEKNGLKVGQLKRGLQREYLMEQLLLEIPELAWATIHVQGTKIVIEVAEKTLPPEGGVSQPADLIARIGGKIEELLILKGTPLVKEGDLVQAGQTLIEGVFYPQIQINTDGSITPSGEPEPVRAQGLVRARVVRELEASCPLKEELLQDTGQEVKVKLLSWQGGDLVLFGQRTVPFAKYRQIKEARTLYEGRKLKGPIEVITIVYREQESKIKNWGLEGAYQEAVRRARQQLNQELPEDCLVISEKAEPVSSEEEGLVKIIYSLETKEDIGGYAD